VCFPDPLQRWYLRGPAAKGAHPKAQSSDPTSTSDSTSTSDPTSIDCDDTTDGGNTDRQDGNHSLEETADSYNSLLHLLRCEIARLQPARLVTIGASVGGYAALRAGLALSSDPLHTMQQQAVGGGHATPGPAHEARPASTPVPVSILAFGPQVFLDPSERQALELPAMFFDHELAELHSEASAARVPVEAAHAVWARQMRAREAGASTTSSTRSSPRIEIHVGADAIGDVREAALLREAIAMAAGGAHVAVQVQVHEGLGHALVKDLRDAGVLEDLLKRML